MKRKALQKDFDLPDVQDMAFDLSRFWTDEAYATYGEPADVHPDVAARPDSESPGKVLDIGCGTGLLKGPLEASWFGIDRSIAQLKHVSGHRTIADALRLPFADETFGAAASLYTLYFFEDPSLVAAEAARVLKRGGLFAVCAPSRDSDPEISHLAPRDDVDAFASEDIEEVLLGHFADIEINGWDFPFLEIKEREDLRDYVYFWYYPQFTRSEAARHADTLELPVKLTKKGAWGVGRKR